MGKLEAVIDQMDRARAGLLAAADSVPPNHWRSGPGADAWSAAEVIAHLTMVESAVKRGAEWMVRQAPPVVPFWKRLHMPLRAGEWRLIRRKSPVPLDPLLLSDKEVMLGRIREVRKLTLAFLDQESERDLSVYRRPHPFFGSLNFYDWLRFVAHHEVRHTKQLQEIVDFLQN